MKKKNCKNKHGNKIMKNITDERNESNLYGTVARDLCVRSL